MIFPQKSQQFTDNNEKDYVASHNPLSPERSCYENICAGSNVLKAISDFFAGRSISLYMRYHVSYFAVANGVESSVVTATKSGYRRQYT